MEGERPTCGNGLNDRLHRRHSQARDIMSKTLFILNDPPYGTERSYNGLRLAGSLAKREGEEIRVFLIGDASSCAKRGQKVPNGFYKLENMLRAVLRADM